MNFNDILLIQKTELAVFLEKKYMEQDMKIKELVKDIIMVAIGPRR
ncbi:MAG: hypothetical protein JW969_09575 [Spirochaetales bacterium]|nr:hypothetical protein [Spirochaetales bacterium]